MSSGPQTPSPAPHAESRANSNRKQEQNRTSGPGCDAGSKRVITAESFYEHLIASAITSHPLDGPERKVRQPLTRYRTRRKPTQQELEGLRRGNERRAEDTRKRKANKASAKAQPRPDSEAGGETTAASPPRRGTASV